MSVTKKSWIVLMGCCVLLTMSGCRSTKGSSSNNATSQPGPTSQPGQSNHAHNGMTLVLPETPVRLGQSFVVSVKNTGTTPYEYHFPGGSNGCVLPIYRVLLQHANGQIYQDTYDGPGKMCTRGIVSPQHIVIAAGRTMPLRVETGKIWYTQPKSLTGKSKRIALTPGSYRIWVRGGKLQLSATGLQLQTSSNTTP